MLLTGVYGPGKSSVAAEVAYLLEHRGERSRGTTGGGIGRFVLAHFTRDPRMAGSDSYGAPPHRTASPRLPR